VLSLVPSFIGYRYIHAYQRYAWIPMAIIFVISFGLSVKVSSPRIFSNIARSFLYLYLHVVHGFRTLAADFKESHGRSNFEFRESFL
jgi:purine-cytosine permease-like protein